MHPAIPAAPVHTSGPALAHLAPILRIATALCFIGHGAFGIITKSAWLPYFALAGIGPELAYRLMPVVGMVDILVGIAVLLRPMRAVLAYAVFWCAWTAALRPLTGEAVWEMLERAGNYGVPLAYLMLLGGGAWFASAAREPERRRFAVPPSVFPVLQWTTVLLLVGHGALMIGAKPVFVEHWAAVGAAPEWVPVIGFLELLLALAVAVRPSVALLLFVAGWKLATEALWVPAGYSVWEWIERVGSYAAPFAAALLMQAGAEARSGTVPGLERPATPSAPAARAPSRVASGRGRVALTLLAAAILWLPGTAVAQLPPPDEALLAQLRRGGHVLVCRHAITDHSPQAPTARNRDPLLARPLNGEGEAQAAEIGRLLRALRIPIADVHASPYARTMRSAALTFGNPTAEPALQSSAEAKRRRPLLADTVPAGGNRALVTHQRVLFSDLGMPRGTAPEGFCAIVRPDLNGGFRVIAGAMPDDWARLLRRASHSPSARRSGG